MPTGLDLKPWGSNLPADARADGNSTLSPSISECSAPSYQGVRREQAWGWCSWGGRKRAAWVMVALGVTCAAIAAAIQLAMPRILAKRISSVLVVSSMEEAHRARGFFDNRDKQTRTYLSYYFYNITNADDVRKGVLPDFNMIGPYTFQILRAKHNVSFSDDGVFVDYTENVEAVFQPDKSDGGLEDIALVINLAYITGVSKKRSEKNMLLQGVRNTLSGYHTTRRLELKKHLAAFVMGGWGARPGDLTAAMTKAVQVLGEDEAYRRWGAEGLGSAQELLDLQEDDADLAYWNRLMNPNVKLTPEVVAMLMDPTKANSLVYLNQPDAPLSGFASWSTGKLLQPAAGDGLAMEADQRSALTLWAWGMIEAAQTLDRAVRVYNDVVAAEGQETAVVTFDDLLMRQFYGSDVLAKLGLLPVDTLVGVPVQGATAYVTGDPETSPLLELGYYLRVVEERTMEEVNRNWTPSQGDCALDAVLANKTYYEHRVLGIPAPYYYDDYALENERINLPIKKPLEECMDLATNFDSYYNYLVYLGEKAVKPLFQAFVVNNKGSLMEPRTVGELVLGHKEPLLAVSLPFDNPSAKSFAMQPHEPLDAAPRCESSGDVEDFKTGCVDLGFKVNGNRVFSKVPSRFHTGKGDVSRLGQLELYHGQRQVDGMWGGHFDISGGAKGLPGSIQHGFTGGTQFPPLNAIKKADSLYAMRTKGPVVFKIDRHGTREVEGVNLIKFEMSPGIFNTTPNNLHPEHSFRDHYQDGRVLATMDMAGRYINATYTGSPVYFSPMTISAPHHPRKPSSPSPGTLQGGSFFAVEPITGMTMEWALELQLSVSLTDYTCGDLDIFHKDVPKLPIFPVSVIRSFGQLHPHDAEEFKGKVYRPLNRVNVVMKALAVGGGLTTLLGLVMLFLVLRRGKQDPNSDRPKKVLTSISKLEEGVAKPETELPRVY